jgi:hypothetical protein
MGSLLGACDEGLTSIDLRRAALLPGVRNLVYALLGYRCLAPERHDADESGVCPHWHAA